jgi:predicted CoA-binding protein
MSREPTAPPDQVLRAILAARPAIALVGASSRTGRPSHEVMRRLLAQRYPVIPVNPNESQVLGLACYPDLRSIPRRIGLVDVFRRAEACPEVARAAVEVGARALWLQSGVVSDEAAAIARAAGLLVVMDRCTMVEHDRLLGRPFDDGESSPATPDPVGLCRDCRHARPVPAAAASYWLCRRSASEPAFPKYPALPVRACRGFQWSESGGPHR